MATPGSALGSAPRLGGAGLEGLDAMAALAHETRLVVHLILPRAPGVVEHAREVARQTGVECSADIRARTVRVCFQPNT